MPRRSAWVVVSLSWALACGGRFQRGGEGEGDESVGGTSDGQGGSAEAQAGNASRAGTTSSGAVSSGTAGTFGVGGATAVGGVGTGGGCTCDPIGCPVGYLTVPSPSGCCYECQIDYKSCDRQRQNYASYRQAVLFKYTPYECTTSADCAMYYDKNECQVYSCGELVNLSSWAALDAELNAFASMNCNPACPPPPIPPCAPPSTPTCFRGSCE